MSLIFCFKMQWNQYEKGVMVLVRVLVQTSWFMIATYVLLVSNVASGPWSFNATKRVNASLVHGCCRPWSGWPMRVMTCLELDHWNCHLPMPVMVVGAVGFCVIAMLCFDCFGAVISFVLPHFMWQFCAVWICVCRLICICDVDRTNIFTID